MRSRENERAVCKRVVLVNVPSFRFFVPLFIFLYPRSGFGGPGFCALVPVFWGPGTSAKTISLETTLLRSPGEGIISLMICCRGAVVCPLFCKPWLPNRVRDALPSRDRVEVLSVALNRDWCDYSCDKGVWRDTFLRTP